MTNDTRDRNTYFRSEEIGKYVKEYTGALAGALNKVSEYELEKVHRLIEKTHAWGRIFVGGNGGSAAISDHLTCDFVKGTLIGQTMSLRVHSLVGNQALLTAVANDCGYENIFSWQLEAATVCSKDIVILISSSGNSKNIINAIDVANRFRVPVIGLTGFDGGELYKRADVRLHVPFNNYGIVEDCHQALMHIIAQFYYLKLIRGEDESE